MVKICLLWYPVAPIELKLFLWKKPVIFHAWNKGFGGTTIIRTMAGIIHYCGDFPLHRLNLVRLWSLALDVLMTINSEPALDSNQYDWDIDQGSFKYKWHWEWSTKAWLSTSRCVDQWLMLMHFNNRYLQNCSDQNILHKSFNSVVRYMYHWYFVLDELRSS